MSITRRTLVLNPVEPAPISMKFRTGLENVVDLEYLRQNGAPYNTDFAAQMYLISRTQGTVKAYVLPATDAINGRARGYIPAGDITDQNGYNVQIIGLVEGEQRLIAKGSASVYETEALGIIPVDLIDRIDITLSYNEDASLDVALWQDVGKTTPYKIMPPPVSANIWSEHGGNVLASFSVEKVDVNVVRLTMTEETINTLPANAWWSLSVTTTGGLTTLAQGDVIVTGDPLPDFIEEDFLYEYIKQDALTPPGSGECIHSNNVLDTLRFSMYDNEGTDRRSWLDRMVPGSTILLKTPVPPPPEVPDPPDPLPDMRSLPTDGSPYPREDPPPVEPAGTLWTILGVSKIEGIQYYQFVVEPAEQAPETGEQTFTFTR